MFFRSSEIGKSLSGDFLGQKEVAKGTQKLEANAGARKHIGVLRSLSWNARPTFSLIDELCVAQKRRSTEFEALKLVKGLVGCARCLHFFVRNHASCIRMNLLQVFCLKFRRLAVLNYEKFVGQRILRF